MGHHRSFAPRSPPSLLPLPDRRPSEIGNILDPRMGKKTEFHFLPSRGRRGVGSIQQHSLLLLSWGGGGRAYGRIDGRGKVSGDSSSCETRRLVLSSLNCCGIGKNLEGSSSVCVSVCVVTPSHHHLTRQAFSLVPCHPFEARETRHLKLDHRDTSSSRSLRLDASYAFRARVPLCWERPSHPSHRCPFSRNEKAVRGAWYVAHLKTWYYQSQEATCSALW